jgi:hypothetical protein
MGSVEQKEFSLPPRPAAIWPHRGAVLSISARDKLCTGGTRRAHLQTQPSVLLIRRAVTVSRGHFQMAALTVSSIILLCMKASKRFHPF